MKLRSVLFWLHLACGVVAGAVILIMSVTGVLLTYQRQITAWADMRGYRSEPSPGSTRLPADELVARVKSAHPDLAPTTIVLRSDPAAPASLAVGPARQMFVNPYSGAVLGEGNGQGVRTFFRSMVEWHRYVAMAGESRPTGRAITGAANLMFLFIVVSGLFLWWPCTWTWAAVKSIVWFRGGLTGRARDFNWHNTIGFWSAIPLAIIVAGGVVISYPWATALVYRAYGEQPPAPAGGLAARGGGPGGRAGGPAARTGGPRSAPADRGPAEREPDASVAPLELLLAKAQAQMPEWKTISIALPSENAPRVVLTLDAGDGGQPHKRASLTVNRRTGEVERWEPYASQSAGRRARTWLRFAHTGEVYGIPGQTVAGLVTAGATVLVWTGIALALRRFWSSRKRGRATFQNAA
ncbi:MAG: PepSY domain-containing protein [Acidobacteria bacterium]|nr:MAG: PepSY domain-containing protein [Acidobacteriota bacterium]